jgi:hypothetical protein
VHVFDSTENKIKDKLSIIAEEAITQQWKGNTFWTSKIKERICDLGKNLGYKIQTNKKSATNADWGEWLFDLTWLDYSEGMVLEVPLALECEWSQNIDEIDADFQKLIICRADHRVMIFQQANLSKIKDIIESFKKQISNFRRTETSDRYLFVGFHWDEGKFFFEAYQPVGSLP